MGEGAPALSWVRPLATDPVASTRDAGLAAADSHTSSEKSPFQNGICEEERSYV